MAQTTQSGLAGQPEMLIVARPVSWLTPTTPVGLEPEAGIPPNDAQVPTHTTASALADISCTAC